jgi:putative transposase
MDVRLREIIREVCAERDATIVELQVMPNHVHLLVNCDQQYGIHRLVKRVKGRSSRLLRTKFPYRKSRMPTLWSNSYFVATVGGANLEVVKRYVENQRNG